MVEHVFDALVKNIENGNWQIIIFIIAFALVIKIPAIFAFYENRRSKKEVFLKEAILLEAVTGATRIFAVEAINSIVFYHATGIMAEKPLREKIDEIYKKSHGMLSIFQFRRAQKYLKITNGCLSVEVNLSDKIEAAFNLIFAFFLAVVALLIFILSISIAKVLALKIFTLLGISFMFLIFAMFLLMQTIPFSIAKKIKPIIDSIENAAQAPGVIEKRCHQKATTSFTTHQK